MTEIRLYNTRTRSKEIFVPIDPENVRMYVCGPTVYDRAHIGNARPVVVFDVLYRLLRRIFGADHVTYARNFTDVDDRIIEKAVATKAADETLEDATKRITNETIGWYHEDMDALGALRPDVEPRCTEMIPQMVEMTEALIDRGHAYAAENHVLFSVESHKDYGSLSGRSVDDMIAGARVEVAPYKKNPMDFVIWKPSTGDQPGWPSPWGRGRPGWHIECSAMAKDLFGEVFDIHAGGIDLAFPHHENELAQSCCAHETDRMANWWMHNEMLRVEGEKMSKSLGNFFTVRELLDDEVEPEVVRYVLLSSHYRQTIDWTKKRIDEARSALTKFTQVLGRDGPVQDRVHLAEGEPDVGVLAALADDLNTPLALSRLHHIAGSKDPITPFDFAATLGALGFDWADLVRRYGHDQKLRNADEHVEALINQLLADRQSARQARDFARADAIRDGFTNAGVSVTDTADGATWELSKDFDPSKLEALK